MRLCRTNMASNICGLTFGFLAALMSALFIALLPVSVQADLKEDTRQLNRFLSRMNYEQSKWEKQQKREQQQSIKSAGVSRQVQTTAAGPDRESLLNKMGGLVKIPGGCFQMGNSQGDAYQLPVHQVCLGDFWMAKYEVTQGLWNEVMGYNASDFKQCGDSCPADNVSWNIAQKFIRNFNERTGLNARLPTEAEWEYACRAGASNSQYCGGNSAAQLAWYDKNSGATPRPVGGKQANAYGLYDMSGNVMEWVQDCWYANYRGAPNDGSAREQVLCFRRTMRGGSWSESDLMLTPSKRTGMLALERRKDLGFRIVVDDYQ